MTADLAEEQTAAQLATERLETEQVTIESWAPATICETIWKTVAQLLNIV